MSDNFTIKLMESVQRAKMQKMSWELIPAEWHDWLIERGLLSYSEAEKRKAWNDSNELIEDFEMKMDRVEIAKKLLVYRKKIK